MTCHGSFCGDEYDQWGEVDLADSGDDDRRCDMTLADDPSVEAGGMWTVSVYELPAADASTSNVVELNSASGSSSVSSGTIHGDEGTGAGGTTDVGETRDPVPSGTRAFTVVNKCSSTIRVGSTGGR